MGKLSKRAVSQFIKIFRDLMSFAYSLKEQETGAKWL